MALAIREVGAKSLEVPIAAATNTHLSCFLMLSDIWTRLSIWDGFPGSEICSKRALERPKMGDYRFCFISSSSCEPLATLGGGGRRLSNFQVSHLIVQQAEPVGSTESWRRRQQGVASRASDAMDWTAYRRPSGKSHSALWTSPAGCSGSTWRQVFAPVIFRLLFNLGSIFDHNHGTSKKDSRGTQEPNNKSYRQSRRTSPLTAPWPVALLGSGVLLALSESSTERVAQVAGGSFTSRPLRRCLFPLFAVGVFATAGTLDRVGSTV